MPIQELLLLHHTHTDLGYTHPQPVVWQLHNRYIDEAIAYCEQTADWPEACRMKWTCEVTCTLLHWLDHASDAQIRRLRALVRNGQVGFGAMWAHWMLPLSGDLLAESLAPVRLIREQFGAPVSVAIQHDVNGLPWAAVDRLLDAGIPHLLMGINTHMGGFPLRRPMAFRWEGAAGRSLLVFSGEHYNTFSREAGLRVSSTDLERAEQGLQKYFAMLIRKGWKHDFAFLTAAHPFMDDNGPPNPELPGFVRLWNDQGRSPRIRLVLPEQLFDRLRLMPEAALPLHRGDWTDYWANGAGSFALETAMMRRGRAAWASARTLAQQSSVPLDARTEAHAVRQLLIAHEHTATAFSSTAALGPSRQMEPFSAAEQWNHKAGHCASALSWARMLRRDALDAVAGNPVQARAAMGLLAFNPSELPRRGCVRVPRDLLAGHDALLAGTKHRLDVVAEMLNDRTSDWVGPLDLPALGVAKWSFSSLPRNPAAEGLKAASGMIESAFFTLRFDPVSGRIRSLETRAQRRECVDAASPWECFGAVRETVAAPSAEAQAAGDLRYDLFQITEKTFQRVHDDEPCWNGNWPARHERAEAVSAAVRLDPEGAHLIRVMTLPGMEGEMHLTITLLAHEPRVRFDAYFNKGNVSDPEALYFTFPFAISSAQMYYDAGGQATAFDTEQLAGASRGWLAAGDWVAVDGRGGCVVVACPDAPLWQVGGFNFARKVTNGAGLNQALLIAWPMNNYWNTNFPVSQPGFIRLRWEMEHIETFSPLRCAQFGTSAARPAVWHPLASLSP